MESWEREKVRLGRDASDTVPESHWESVLVKALLMPPLDTEPPVCVESHETLASSLCLLIS